jgi:hypothetical protein
MQQTLPQMIAGAVQWAVVIVSVLGTIALFTWIAVMFFRKDHRPEFGIDHSGSEKDDATRNRP